MNFVILYSCFSRLLFSLLFYIIHRPIEFCERMPQNLQMNRLRPVMRFGKKVKMISLTNLFYENEIFNV